LQLAQLLTDPEGNYMEHWTGYFSHLKMRSGPVEIATITRHEGFQWIQRVNAYAQI
jgi:hypothetical protein